MIGELLKTKKALIGMVHLPALPGAPCYRGASVEEIMSQVCRDRDALIDAGFDALSFSNEGDAPFLSQAPVETVALMSRLIHEASQGLDVPFGCGFLVDAKATLALARAVGADFVRVSFGVTAGMFGFSDSPAGPLLRYQKEIGAEDVALLINVSAHFADEFGHSAVYGDRTELRGVGSSGRRAGTRRRGGSCTDIGGGEGSEGRSRGRSCVGLKRNDRGDDRVLSAPL